MSDKYPCNCRFGSPYPNAPCDDCQTKEYEASEARAMDAAESDERLRAMDDPS